MRFLPMIADANPHGFGMAPTDVFIKFRHKRIRLGGGFFIVPFGEGSAERSPNARRSVGTHIDEAHGLSTAGASQVQVHSFGGQFVHPRIQAPPQVARSWALA